MRFSLSENQQVVNEAVERLLQRYRNTARVTEFCLFSAQLDQELQDSGFCEAGSDPDLGTVSAVHVVEEVAKLPFCSEIMSSTLIRPRFCPQLPRPIALMASNHPIRFAPMARTILVIRGDEVRALDAECCRVRPVSTLLAYPYASIDIAESVDSLLVGKAHELYQWWRLGLAAECLGAMQSGLSATVEHVSTRIQFGRPLGANQAIQHRLAEAAVTVEALRWLTYYAAYTATPADAAAAAAYAQDAIPKLTYDLHQFSGAIGLTLEHPLHLWTYRLRALVAELGGPSSQLTAVANFSWNCPSNSDATA